MTKSTSQLFTKRAFKYFKPFILLGEKLFFYQKNKNERFREKYIEGGWQQLRFQENQLFQLFLLKIYKNGFLISAETVNTLCLFSVGKMKTIFDEGDVLWGGVHLLFVFRFSDNWEGENKVKLLLHNFCRERVREREIPLLEWNKIMKQEECKSKKVFKFEKFFDCSAFRFENIGVIKKKLGEILLLSFFWNLIQFRDKIFWLTRISDNNPNLRLFFLSKSFSKLNFQPKCFWSLS